LSVTTTSALEPVWRGGLPAAIIDWDNAAPFAPLDDLGYGLWKQLNLGLVDLPATEQRRRLRVISAAYDMPADQTLLSRGLRAGSLATWPRSRAVARTSTPEGFDVLEERPYAQPRGSRNRRTRLLWGKRHAYKHSPTHLGWGVGPPASRLRRYRQTSVTAGTQLRRICADHPQARMTLRSSASPVARSAEDG
jgi:hypothetical protein